MESISGACFGLFWIFLGLFLSFIALFWVRRGLKMIVSHRPLTSLNMSPYRAIWTHFRPIFIFFIDLIRKICRHLGHVFSIHQGFPIDLRWNWERYTITKLT